MSEISTPTRPAAPTAAPARRGGCLTWSALGIGAFLLLCVGLGIIGALAGDSGRATPTTVASRPTQASAMAARTAPASSGGAATPTPTLAPPKLKIGDALAARNWTLTVTSVERMDALVWSAFGNKEQALGEWMVVAVALTNTGATNHTVHSWDFELRTADGKTIEHTTELAAAMYNERRGGVPLGKQIPPGTTVTTYLAFDIPKGAQGLDLVFAQAKDRPINVG